MYIQNYVYFRVHAGIDEMDVFINIDLNTFLDVSTYMYIVHVHVQVQVQWWFYLSGPIREGIITQISRPLLIQPLLSYTHMHVCVHVLSISGLIRL